MGDGGLGIENEDRVEVARDEVGRWYNFVARLLRLVLPLSPACDQFVWPNDADDVVDSGVGDGAGEKGDFGDDIKELGGYGTIDEESIRCAHSTNNCEIRKFIQRAM